MELNKKNIKTIILLIMFTVLFVYVVKNIPFILGIVMKIINVFFPFILGLCFAFVLNVIVSLIENKLKKIKKLNNKTRRIISITISMLIVLLVISFVLVLVIPDLIDALTQLINTLPIALTNLDKCLTNLVKDYPGLKNYIDSINFDNITSNLVNFVTGSMDVLLSNSINFISNIISSITSFVMGIVFSVYILAQKETLALQVKKVMKAYLSENVNNKIFEILDISNKTFYNFITGQCLEALILGTMFLIAMTIFKFPYALAISSLITVTALIPIFGALIASIFGVILIAVTSPVQAFWFFVMFQIIQQIENNLIYPKVVGKKVGLPALWVMLAVLVGGNLFGLVGMLVSVPISSILYSIFKTKVNERVNNDR